MHYRYCAIAGALLLCAGTPFSGAHAQAMESAQQFWLNQQRARQDAVRSQDFRPQDYGGGYGPLGYGEWTPQSAPFGPAPATPRAPHVTVKSPQYYDYKPDALEDVNLGSACQVEVAAKAGQPALSETTGGQPMPAAPAPTPEARSFARACTQSPTITLRMLPAVGKALIAYYRAHPGFIWIEKGNVSPKAMAAMAELAASDRYGLKPADYRVALPPANLTGAARQQAVLRFEFALSAKALTYVLDARRGRVAPDRISGYHDLPRKRVDMVAALGKIAQAPDVAAYLARQNPDNARFRALVAELQKLRAHARPPIDIAPDTLIKPGESDPALGKVVAAILRVGSSALKKQYAAALAQGASARTYTPDRVALVRDFQRERGLSVDGIIGPHTVAALNGHGSADRVEKVKLAMERLRWLPRHLGRRYVFLNEPAFRVNYVDGNKVVLSTKAVIGQVSKQTYFFTDHIKSVEYNPYWNVPRSILINEMLPHLYRNPSYLSERGFQVTDERGRRVPSAAVNWGAVAADRESVDVRQPPGNGNALGRLKIEFPNSHAIYMHDTPEKQLFDHTRRAFSHGCVRLQKPRAMAAALLGTGIGHVDKQIAEGANASQPVPGDIPVYLAYFTAWPDLHGAVHYYADVYGRDAHLASALAKTEAARAKG
jgi:murein L,D-transpeptidase YcbB/YkuD